MTIPNEPRVLVVDDEPRYRTKTKGAEIVIALPQRSLEEGARIPVNFSPGCYVQDSRG